MDWLPLETAPKDGTVIQLRGRRHRSCSEVVDIEGHYDTGGFTEGWEDEKGNWFCPEQWKPLEKEKSNNV